MRQVNRDELVWDLYAGLRQWTTGPRKRLFAPPHLRQDSTCRIYCDRVTLKLGYLEILDPASRYRRLRGEELTEILVGAVAQFPGAIPRLWQSGVKERETEAQAAAANLFADRFDRFEILAATPLGQSGVEVFFPRIETMPYALLRSWP